MSNAHKWLASFVLSAVFVAACVGLGLVMQHKPEWLIAPVVILVIGIVAAAIRESL